MSALKMKKKFALAILPALSLLCLSGGAEAFGGGPFDGVDTKKIPLLAMYVGEKGHAYYVYPPGTAATYKEAQLFCFERGGHLATFDNIKENRAVYVVMRDMGYDHAYIGLSCAPGGWQWEDGKKLGFQNWKDGGKNPVPAGNGKYAMMTYAPPVYVLPDGTVTGEKPEKDVYEFLPDASCAWSLGAFDDAGGSPFICEWGH